MCPINILREVPNTRQLPVRQIVWRRALGPDTVACNTDALQPPVLVPLPHQILCYTAQLAIIGALRDALGKILL